MHRELGQAKVGRLTTTVTDDQNGDLIGAGTSSSPDAPASASWPRQMALSLERFQEEGFVGFDNPAFVRGPMLGDLLQKPVTPEEGGVLVDPTTPGGGSYAYPVDQRLTIAQPLLTLAQPRQWRAAKGLQVRPLT